MITWSLNSCSNWVGVTAACCGVAGRSSLALFNPHSWDSIASVLPGASKLFMQLTWLPCTLSILITASLRRVPFFTVLPVSPDGYRCLLCWWLLYLDWSLERNYFVKPVVVGADGVEFGDNNVTAAYVFHHFSGAPWLHIYFWHGCIFISDMVAYLFMIPIGAVQ